MTKIRYSVSRQRQWPDGDCVVEISGGDHNYTNPGAMGCTKEFTLATEAVEYAITTALDWQKSLGEEVLIGRGYTGGNTMPFDPEPLDEETFQEYRDWAKKDDDSLEKCTRCGDPVTEKLEDEDGFSYCSSDCLQRAIEDYEAEFGHNCSSCGKGFFCAPEETIKSALFFGDEVFCSKECRDDKIRRRGITVEEDGDTCDQCGALFLNHTPPPENPEEAGTELVFCSTECQQAHLIDNSN